MGAILGALSALGSIAKAVMSFIGMFQKQQERKDYIEKGQLEQKTVDQQVALDAHKRMEEAGAQPHDDKTTSDRLRSGNF